MAEWKKLSAQFNSLVYSMKREAFASFVFVLFCSLIFLGCHSSSQETNPIPSPPQQKEENRATVTQKNASSLAPLPPSPSFSLIQPVKTDFQEDVDYAKLISEREALIQNLMKQKDQNQEESASSLEINTFSSQEQKNASFLTNTIFLAKQKPQLSSHKIDQLLDQIEEQLKRFQTLGVPPIYIDEVSQFLPTIYFSYDISSVHPHYQNMLSELGIRILPKLKKRGTLILQIEGHADERGAPEYNILLGSERAIAVYQFLQTYSQHSKQWMKTISYGEEKPAVFGRNEVAYKKNRRVSFSFQLKSK